MVLVGVFGMQRDPALWDHPLEFDPDRFSPQNIGRLDRWQYIPFGAGPRSCIGDHFAMLEATLALATIIRTIEIESLAADFPLAVPFTMVAGCAHPGARDAPGSIRRVSIRLVKVTGHSLPRRRWINVSAVRVRVGGGRNRRPGTVRELNTPPGCRPL
jgi:hypothetical protein